MWKKGIYRTVFGGMVVLALSACGRTGKPTVLDRFVSADGKVLEGREITLAGPSEADAAAKDTDAAREADAAKEAVAGQADREPGETASVWFADGDYRNFILTGEACLEKGAEASLFFHTDVSHSSTGKGEDGHSGTAGASDGIGLPGYEVVFHNGPIDGTVKTGSLAAVRNLYRSLADDTEWFTFEIAVRGKNISISIDSTEVVCYTEPENPYRTEAYAGRLLGHGRIALKGVSGKMMFSDLTVIRLPDNAVNPCDTMPVPDEQNDPVIRLQQRNFPVIDYHVHLKGGLTKEMAHAMSMNYGINYGVAPNAGEGGVGRMLADDDDVYEYFNEVKDMPFFRGVQGEGRRWTMTFSREALGVFDYLFTDAMTIVDHKGRLSRIYKPEEVHYDGITKEEYMDHLVDQTVKILTNEPADIYANPTYIPDDMAADYGLYWTEERVDKVLDVLEKYDIALEINARYRIPSFDIIRKAKERGIRFTFGTNNVDADFGRLEYCLEAVEECGLTPDDLWFPSMSIRSGRPVVIYNDL